MIRAALLLAALAAPVLAQAPSPAPAPPDDQIQAPAWVPKRTAQLQALDKVTARITVLDAPLNQPVRFGTLTIIVRSCNARPADEVPDAAAFIEVRDALTPASAPPAFRGWMLANAPAANMLEHPVYDLRILECR